MLRVLCCLALAACASDPIVAIPDATEPLRTGVTPVDPGQHCPVHLAPNDAPCCILACDDPRQFQAECAPQTPGQCVSYLCPTADGGALHPGACRP